MQLTKNVFLSPHLKSRDKSFYLGLVKDLSEWGYQVKEDSMSNADGPYLLLKNALSLEEKLKTDIPVIAFETDEQTFQFLNQPNTDDVKYFTLATNEYQQYLKSILDFYYANSYSDEEIENLKKAKRNFKELTEAAKNYLEFKVFQGTFNKSFFKLMKDIYSFYSNILTYDNVDTIFAEFVNFINDKIEVGQIKRINLNQYSQDSMEDSEHKVLPIMFENKRFMFFSLETYNRSFHERQRDSFIIGYCIYLIESYFSIINEFDSLISKNELIEDAFKAITSPMCLLSDTGELLYHNSSFVDIKLAPKKVFQLAPNETIQIDNRHFKVIKHEINHEDQNYIYAHFQDSEFSGASKSSLNPEELGIITSSMAHELNNPLAGILTAISLLKISYDWSSEDQKQIADMEEGGKRCKNLVEIFLGFSRARQQQTFKQTTKESFEQAINLLSFRIVETNVKMNIDWRVSKAWENLYQTNGAVFSMAFYLILSTIFTRFSHQMMVENNAKNVSIDGSIFDEGQSLVMRFKQEFRFADEIKELQLVDHLLKMENVSLSLQDRQITFHFNRLKQ